MTNSGSSVIKLESFKLIAIHGDVCVSEIDAVDIVQESLTLTFQITDESLTGLLLSVSQARNESVQSRLDDGGVQEISNSAYLPILVKFRAIGMQAANVTFPVKHVAVKKDRTAVSPDGGTPDKVVMLGGETF